ncbi:hypothetical protein IFR05_001327 [Cadophora sp. M221]|nr:hypothetical protein IFR05_001327 [Cadophora sp. M221]
MALESKSHEMLKDAKGEVTKKHISTACKWCRNRKMKCDGKTPSCSNCVLYSRDCEYNYFDKRKLSHKTTIQSLLHRISTLESVLQEHGIEVPPEAVSSIHVPVSDISMAYLDRTESKSTKSTKVNQTESLMKKPTSLQTAEPSEDWSTLGDITKVFNASENLDSNLSLPSHDGYHRSSNSHFSPGQQFDSNLTQSYDYLHVPPPTWHPPPSSEGNMTSANLQKETSENMSNTSPLSSSKTMDRASEHDDIMDQLSGRMGRFQIAEDGQLRYFGATSNLHILHDGLSSLLPSHSPSVRTDGQEALLRADLVREIDSDLIQTLQDLYFRWEDAAIHVVDEDMYYSAREAYKSGQDGNPFYSETLENAICAVGSCLSNGSNQGSSQEIALFYSARAKLLLEVEMDSPSVATVQALVIMSAIEAAFTKDARGWLYSGMAVRLSSDLGLHLDLRNDVCDGVISARELEARRTTFWGVFTHDNMWSLYVGRPPGINIQDISVSRPEPALDEQRQKRWIWPPNRSENFSNMQEVAGFYDPVEACADANIELCSMMRELRQTVYSGETLPSGRLQEFAAKMRHDFRMWETALPNELRVDLNDGSQSYLPHVLQLHMQFYAVSILLHRPFFSRSVKSTESMSQPSMDDPRLICISAAKSIVQLLRFYKRQHTLSRTNVHIVHLIFTASLICVYNACVTQGAAAMNSLDDLQFCCKALGEIGECYQNAMRALEVIICIKRKWFAKSRDMSRTKRLGSTGGVPDFEGTSRKRRLTQTTQNTTQQHLNNSTMITADPETIFYSGNLASHPAIDIGIWQPQTSDLDLNMASSAIMDDFFGF